VYNICMQLSIVAWALSIEVINFQWSTYTANLMYQIRKLILESIINSNLSNIAHKVILGTTIPCGHVVAQMIEALCFRLEGVSFNFWSGQSIFSIYLILLATPWPWGLLSL
jgi:hypothetical protein